VESVVPDSGGWKYSNSGLDFDRPDCPTIMILWASDWRTSGADRHGERFASREGNVLPSNTLRKREETGVQQVSASQSPKTDRR
jgi:hypothetical protein